MYRPSSIRLLKVSHFPFSLNIVYVPNLKNSLYSVNLSCFICFAGRSIGFSISLAII